MTNAVDVLTTNTQAAWHLNINYITSPSPLNAVVGKFHGIVNCRSTRRTHDSIFPGWNIFYFM